MQLVFRQSVLALLVTANVPSSLILVTLMMEARSFSESSVLMRTTRHHIPEDGILHSHRSENFIAYEMTIFSETSLLLFS
jgi:hypothetical protein